MQLRSLSLCAFLFISISTAHSDPLQATVVDIVPASLSNESEQNSEPNIAVNPVNPAQIVITAFGNGPFRNPVYATNNGGASWIVMQYIGTSDTSVAWSDSSLGYLAQTNVSGNTLVGARTLGAGLHRFGYLGSSFYRPGGEGPDQPWVFANKGLRQDHIFIAFNDLRQPARTASIRFSLDTGRTWRNTVIERVIPGDKFDGAAVRVAAVGNTVYAAFERNNSQTSAGDEQGDLVVVKDTAGGLHRFTDLGTAGVVAASDQVFPMGNLGLERLGSDLSIAVDPSNADRVFVACARVVNGQPDIAVLLSTDGGSHWTTAYDAGPGTALPALAVASNGTAGLLFTKLASGYLETHFAQSNASFSTISEQTLSRFANGTPALQFQPYIGDYQDLVAVGGTFYGTYSASNDISALPGQPVTFLRDQSKLGGAVPYSIDPFFFTIPAL